MKSNSIQELVQIYAEHYFVILDKQNHSSMLVCNSYAGMNKHSAIAMIVCRAIQLYVYADIRSHSAIAMLVWKAIQQWLCWYGVSLSNSWYGQPFSNGYAGMESL